LNALYPTILFENKDYERNEYGRGEIPTRFALQNNGIFIQTVPLPTKKLPIDIVNGIIHVYIQSRA
jgi:hypothetical protein